MKCVPRMDANNSGGIIGFCFAMMKVVFFMVSVATTTLLSASVYLLTISGLEPPSSTAIFGYSRDVDLTFEKHTNRHFDHGVCLCRFVFVDLVQANVVLAITGCCELRHSGCVLCLLYTVNVQETGGLGGVLASLES